MTVSEVLDPLQSSKGGRVVVEMLLKACVVFCVERTRRLLSPAYMASASHDPGDASFEPRCKCLVSGDECMLKYPEAEGFQSMSVPEYVNCRTSLGSATRSIVTGVWLYSLGSC